MRDRHEQQLHDIAVVSRMAIYWLGLSKSEFVQNLRSMVAEDDNAKSADQMLRTFGRSCRLFAARTLAARGAGCERALLECACSDVGG